ncbi:DNA polymerase I [Helicobacter mehlei]|uniref:DNA polymerase I n=1 Tax=Helicobacter mehlei TaxID=2316080 RepID=UPI000EB2729B|nr:DNA polymerase I [Helicobacter mehlei]
MKTIHLVDTFNLLFKFYYPFRDWHTSAGFNTAWLSAFAHVIQKVYKFKANALIFALESPKSQRKTLYPDYKAKRLSPPHLEEQLPIIFDWIKQMDLCALSVEGYESDDVIASLSTLFSQQGYQVRILSNDKDFYQLVSPSVCVHDFAGNTDRGVAFCLEKYKIPPHQFRDYQGLVGDSSDGYKGVEGIGPAYAIKLLNAFENLENLYDPINSPKLASMLPPKLLDALIRDKNQAFLSRQLATLQTNLFTSTPPALFPTQNPLLRISHELKKYEMFALLKQITPTTLFESTPPTPKLAICTPKQATEWLTPFDRCAIQLVKTSNEVLGLGILAITGKPDTQAFIFVDIRQDFTPFLHALYQRHIIGYQLKDVFNAFRATKIPLPKHYDDIALLAWLVHSSLEPTISALAQVFKSQAHPLHAIKEINLNTLAGLALDNTRLIAQAYSHYQNTLSPDLWQIAHDLEYPLLETLFEMEGHGFSIDREYFQALYTQFVRDLEDLQKSIQEMVGAININSSKQWAQLLYQQLALPTKGIKKNKTGFSTDEMSLKTLQENAPQSVQGIDVHTLLGKLLEYREIFKLQSTYLQPILDQYTAGKIHTTFYQNTTASSRLSSAHPNLQNIPIRTPLGKKIAQGFIASPHMLLLGIDYSQIELRLLAHFSQDAHLITAFKQDQDIHLNTAQALFGDQALEKRAIAKSINFALIYGMGPKRLSQSLKISLEEAKKYIQHYFNTFPTIQDFLEQLKARIEQEGEITTLLGHKRHFDFSHASPKLRADYLREGVNTLFQGSASDLVKLAMLKIQEYTKQHPQIKMLVQVHDEIILEVPQEQAPQIARDLKELMENIYPLSVPLSCHANLATNWGDLKG